jgi:hypothetical protein
MPNKQLRDSPYKSVLEDLDWLRNTWWLEAPDNLDSGDLRRGSSTLRLLLIDGLLQRAWKHHGFQKQPTVTAPDLSGLAKVKGYRTELAIGVIAGGGRQNGIDASFIGAFRVDNPSTGIPADAEEGFAVSVTCIARNASDTPPPSPLDPLINRIWTITDYLQSPGAVRRGEIISRQDIIEYFRNYAGGVHHDQVFSTRQHKRERYEFVQELERAVRADIRDGLHFELLSIGQAIARSLDCQALAERIRTDSQRT